MDGVTCNTHVSSTSNCRNISHTSLIRRKVVQQSLIREPVNENRPEFHKFFRIEIDDLKENLMCGLTVTTDSAGDNVSQC